MDVRCERCATVYEFDEAQIGPNGVTVKCAQCGHLFKVRRKEASEAETREAPKPAVPPVPNRATPLQFGLTQPPSPPATPLPKTAIPMSPTAQASTPPRLPPATAAGVVAYEFWTVKITSTGESFRFREMTTLQQWIVERKVGREDAVSRTGDGWRRLGTIPEFDPFFNIVDRALQAGGMPKAQPDEPTVTASHPARRLAASTSEASLLGDMSGPVGFGTGSDPLSDDSLERRPRRPLWILAASVVGVLVVVAVAYGVSAMRSRSIKFQAVLTQAQQLYALDTDEGFRQAASMLTHAQATDGSDALVLAALAEIKATWASYLREDARALEQTPAAATAAQSFRREAQAHLDEAKKAASDALAMSPEGAEINRAMALALCVDGSPVPEVERYLHRALGKLPSDPSLVWVQALLAGREGRAEEAKQKLQQANQLALSTTGKSLLRALVALAKLAIAKKEIDDAQRLLKSVLSVNPQHDRSKGLLAQVQAPAPVAALAAATPVSASPVAAPPIAPVVAPTPAAHGPPAPAPAPPAPAAAQGPEAPISLEKIIAHADKQLENGRTNEARKLYEKALQMDPRNVEALTGLGYADLDRERFMSAVDNFRKALDVVPDYGEAIIGMAESYKVRGEREKAVEYYQRYIKVLPGGAKASMARANLRDLQVSAKPEPKPESKPEPKEEAKPESKTEAKPEAG